MGYASLVIHSCAIYLKILAKFLHSTPETLVVSAKDPRSIFFFPAEVTLDRLLIGF